MSSFFKNLIVTPLSVLFLIVWLFLFIIMTIIIAIMVLLPFSTSNFVQKLIKFWAKFGFYLTLSRIEFQNEQYFSIKDPIIIITNHRSFIDILLGPGFFKKNFIFLSKKEVFSIPLLGHAMKKAGFIPVDRSSPRKGAQSVLKMINEIKSGKNILIYPEGTRNYKTNQMLPLKAGVMTVAMKSKATILPIVVCDTKNIYSPARKFGLFPQKVKVCPLKPILISNKIHPGNQKSNMTKHEQLENIHSLMQGTFDDLLSKKA